MTKQNSPFKFLDAYLRTDADIWFGRDKETSELYDALSGVKQLLVFGPSGAGKTSLIECGLRNQFEEEDWFALTIRKGGNIISSVYESINEALEEKIDLSEKTKMPTEPDFSFGDAVERLFSERYQPIYLLFDQFEELLILGSEDEQKAFFTRLNDLIRNRVPCRILLIMREEFIGHLSEFEPLCPSIFQHRFRLEKMRKNNVREVILDTLTAPRFQDTFKVEDPNVLADSILAKLPDKRQEIELAHVQVFLDELWDRANTQPSPETLPALSKSLIQEKDDLEGILDSFLKKQLKALEQSYGKQMPIETLAAMISERHTKLQLSEEELQEELHERGIKLKSPLKNLLSDLEKRRLLRTQKSGIKTQYEISHDLLALAVGQNLTEEIKMRNRATEIYGVYEAREGYLSQEDLDYIRPFEVYKPFPTALRERMKESAVYLEDENKKKLNYARQRVVFASVLALIAVGAALWAFSLKNKADEATAVANDQREKTEIALEQLKSETAEKERQRLLAEEKSAEAKRETQRAEEEKTQAEAERQKAEEALTAKQREEAAKNKLQFEEILRNADKLFKARQFSYAKEKYEEALPLAPNAQKAKEVQDKIKQCITNQ